MRRILLVISSPRGAASYSTKVARSLVDKLKADDPGAVVAVRDLAREPLAPIGEDFVTGMMLPAEQRSAPQQAAMALSETLVQELLDADIVVLAAAMINFGLPATLKTWFDHVVRAGLTFRYTEKGAEGLATGKKVYIVEARGGVYSDGPMRANDFQEPYLKALLSFMGMADIEVVAVEGVAFGPEVVDKALTAAFSRISTMTAKAA